MEILHGEYADHVTAAQPSRDLIEGSDVNRVFHHGVYRSISSIVMVMTYAAAVTPSHHALAKPLCLIEQ
jgi:hypothetical protein